MEVSEPESRVTYADIFGEREFRALFVSRALSTVGDYIARAALVIAVFSETGSTALMGVTFALTTLPDLIGGPVLAGLADRFPRRAVMVAAGCLSCWCSTPSRSPCPPA